MPNPLETYIEQFSQSIRSLPVEEREAELREVRHHLESLVTQYMEAGQSLEEAMRSAIRHFGPPATTGEELRRAWRRGRQRAARQAFKRNLRVVVGTHQGQAVINWPGLLLLVALILVINSVGMGALSYALTRDVFFLASSLAFSIPMQLICVVGLGVKRSLQMPPEKLVPLD